MRTIKLVVAYDGSAYHGFQKQKNVQTVQNVLEDALTMLCGEKVVTAGSGRTDAGVHALAQTVTFTTNGRIPCANPVSYTHLVKYADRLLVINAGKVLFDGTPADIFKQHADELVKVGVDVPQVYKLADLLRKNGLAVKENIKDDMSLVKAIKQAKGWK